MKKILILGATSAIATAVARQLGEKGHVLYLVGHSNNKLNILLEDLKTRGIAVAGSDALDLTQTQAHGSLIERAEKALGGLDTVLIAHGLLGTQSQTQKSFQEALKVFEVNFLSAVSLLIATANLMENKKAGTLAVITSVAGDRGRQSNYTYGSAKGALSLYLEGLRNRLYKSGVNVLDIRPGFVDTPMTAHLKKGPLFASPETVAKHIVKALNKGGPDVLYTPGIWYWIMLVIKLIPGRIFKRLHL